jgi:hypothetical protein
LVGVGVVFGGALAQEDVVQKFIRTDALIMCCASAGLGTNGGNFREIV